MVCVRLGVCVYTLITWTLFSINAQRGKRKGFREKKSDRNSNCAQRARWKEHALYFEYPTTRCDVNERMYIYIYKVLVHSSLPYLQKSICEISRGRAHTHKLYTPLHIPWIKLNCVNRATKVDDDSFEVETNSLFQSHTYHFVFSLLAI